MHLTDKSVRLADCTDACDIALLSRREVEYGLPWAWTPGAVARAIADQSVNVAVVSHKGHLTGFAIVYFGRTHAHINLLAVDPAHRRKGIARRLFEWQLESARTAGIRYMTLEVRNKNLGAQHFYQECGFEIRDTVSRYYRNNEDALRMIRKLEVQHES